MLITEKPSENLNSSHKQRANLSLKDKSLQTRYYNTILEPSKITCLYLHEQKSYMTNLRFATSLDNFKRLGAFNHSQPCSERSEPIISNYISKGNRNWHLHFSINNLSPCFPDDPSVHVRNSRRLTLCINLCFSAREWEGICETIKPLGPVTVSHFLFSPGS